MPDLKNKVFKFKMDYVLNHFLPPELVDIIALQVWKMNMKRVHSQIVHNVVRCLSNGEYSFWVSNNLFYYEVYDEDWKRMTDNAMNGFMYKNIKF